MNRKAKQLAAGLACLLVLPSLTACAKDAPPSYRESPLPSYNLTLSRPDFPAEMPGKINKNAIKAVRFQLAPAYTEPLTEALANAASITIQGQAEATEEQMAAFIKRRNPSPKLTCSVEEIVKSYYTEAGKEGIRPDVIVVDPPRKGLTPELIGTIVQMSPQRVVYVSCDPATLARDLKLFTKQDYSVKEITPVDMFPRTSHVESVCLMSRENPHQ